MANRDDDETKGADAAEEAAPSTTDASQESETGPGAAADMEQPPVPQAEAADLSAVAAGIEQLKAMPAVNEPECTNCRFWHEHTPISERAKGSKGIRIGLCRRNPPHVYPVQILPDMSMPITKPGQVPPNRVTQTWSLFPETRGDIWCGAHEPKFVQ